jgi:hypothetical protein
MFGRTSNLPNVQNQRSRVLLQQLDLDLIGADRDLVSGGDLNSFYPLAVDVGAGGAAKVRQNVATVLGLINAGVFNRNGVLI